MATQACQKWLKNQFEAHKRTDLDWSGWTYNLTPMVSKLVIFDFTRITEPMI